MQEYRWTWHIVCWFVCFCCASAPYLTGLSSMMLIWAAGNRCKWRAHLHSRVTWQRFEPQTFQFLGKHFTNELPCNLDVVKTWILIDQSQFVTVKEKIGLPCLLMTDDWQVVVNSFSSQWIHFMIGQLRVLSLVLAPDIIIVCVWSINLQLWTKYLGHIWFL